MATERPFVNLLRGAASWPGKERALNGATDYSRFRLTADTRPTPGVAAAGETGYRARCPLELQRQAGNRSCSGSRPSALAGSCLLNSRQSRRAGMPQLVPRLVRCIRAVGRGPSSSTADPSLSSSGRRSLPPGGPPAAQRGAFSFRGAHLVLGVRAAWGRRQLASQVD